MQNKKAQKCNNIWCLKLGFKECKLCVFMKKKCQNALLFVKLREREKKTIQRRARSYYV